MTEEEKKQLRLALGIISGRKDISILMKYRDEEVLLLGYDPTKMGYYGRPTEDDVRQRAEELVYEHLVGSFKSEEGE